MRTKRKQLAGIAFIALSAMNIFAGGDVELTINGNAEDIYVPIKTEVTVNATFEKADNYESGGTDKWSVDFSATGFTDETIENEDTGKEITIKGIFTFNYTDSEGETQKGTPDDSIKITFVEVTDIELDKKEFFEVNKDFKKEDFKITTLPENNEDKDIVKLDETSFSSTGAQTVTVSCGTSSAECDINVVDMKLSINP